MKYNTEVTTQQFLLSDNVENTLMELCGRPVVTPWQRHVAEATVAFCQVKGLFLLAKKSEWGSLAPVPDCANYIFYSILHFVLTSLLLLLPVDLCSTCFLFFSFIACPLAVLPALFFMCLCRLCEDEQKKEAETKQNDALSFSANPTKRRARVRTKKTTRGKDPTALYFWRFSIGVL